MQILLTISRILHIPLRWLFGAPQRPFKCVLFVFQIPGYQWYVLEQYLSNQTRFQSWFCRYLKSKRWCCHQRPSPLPKWLLSRTAKRTSLDLCSRVIITSSLSRFVSSRVLTHPWSNGILRFHVRWQEVGLTQIVFWKFHWELALTANDFFVGLIWINYSTWIDRELFQLSKGMLFVFQCQL